MAIFNDEFIKFLKENYKNVKVSRNDKGENFVFVANEELISGIILEISIRNCLKNIININLKENEKIEKIIENSMIKKEFKESLMQTIFKWV